MATIYAARDGETGKVVVCDPHEFFTPEELAAFGSGGPHYNERAILLECKRHEQDGPLVALPQVAPKYRKRAGNFVVEKSAEERAEVDAAIEAAQLHVQLEQLVVDRERAIVRAQAIAALIDEGKLPADYE